MTKAALPQLPYSTGRTVFRPNVIVECEDRQLLGDGRSTLNGRNGGTKLPLIETTADGGSGTSIQIYKTRSRFLWWASGA